MASNNLANRRNRDLAAVAFAIVLPSIVTWLYFFYAERWPSHVQGIVFGTVKVIQFTFPAAWVLLVARRKFAIWPISGRGLAIGAALGLTIVAAGVAVYQTWLMHLPQFATAADAMRAKVVGMGIDSPLKYAALGLFYSVCHSLLEEYYWRWFVFGELQRHATASTAIAVSSLGFMAHHVLVVGKYFGFGNWLTWVLSLSVAVGGACWAWLYRRSGSLAGPWLSHLLVDAAIFGIGYSIVRDVLVGGPR